MTHTLTITEGDMISAQRLHATPKPSLSLFLVCVALIVIAAAYAQGQLSSGAAIGGVIGMFGWLALLFLVIIPYRAKRIYRQQRNLHLSHAFWWDDQMVHFRSEDVEGKMRWTDFIKIKENQSMLLLYHSDTLFNMMPKRCFPNIKDLENFKSHLSGIPKG